MDMNNLDEEMLDKTDIMNFLQDTNKMSQKELAKVSGVEILLSNLDTVYNSLVNGDSISHICKTLGVSRTTWYYVKDNSDHFTSLIEFAKQEQIENVKSNLVKKTQDRYIVAEKVLPNGRVVEYNKFMPSDFNAIKFYLLNKAGDEYKEKQEVTIKKTNIIVDIIDDADVIDVETL